MKRALLTIVLVLAGCTPSAVPSPAPPLAVSPNAAPFADCASLVSGPSQLPTFTLPCFTGGQNVQIGQLTGPLVVNFWAPWCGPCRDELPAFQRLAGSGRVPVIGVATDTTRGEATSLATDLRLTMPTLLDIYGGLRRELGIQPLPLTVFVDGSGKVTHYVGPALTDTTLAALVKERLGA